VPDGGREDPVRADSAATGEIVIGRTASTARGDTATAAAVCAVARERTRT